ncbi:MAG: hypothetical protein ACYTHM_09330, partial [Planctomycetota bacterium]
SPIGTRLHPTYTHWLPTAVAVIDFGGHTRGTSGAPLPDLIAANGCEGAGRAHFGKLVVFENRCD